jgi:hypothetical protein
VALVPTGGTALGATADEAIPVNCGAHFSLGDIAYRTGHFLCIILSLVTTYYTEVLIGPKTGDTQRDDR